MLGTIIMLIIAVLILAALWYLLKNVTTLIINSIVGIVVLWLAGVFNLLGMSGHPITWFDVLICAIGGLPGALLIIVLNAVGISV